MNKTKKRKLKAAGWKFGTADDFLGTDYTSGLKARMQAADVTNATLAAEAEIDPSQLSRWFNTEMQPSLRNVNRLEAAFARLTK